MNPPLMGNHDTRHFMSLFHLKEINRWDYESEIFIEEVLLVETIELASDT